MEILENVPLAGYTTFKIGGPARWFCEVKTPEETAEAFEFAHRQKTPVFVLGGGSNLLVSDRGFDGLVTKVCFKGKEILEENSEAVKIKVAAGENWDEIVEWTVKNGWWGLENLSHIPGSCGAIAVQNVGAYGQEASRVLVSTSVFDTTSKRFLELINSECQFGYRSSIFNKQARGRYVIFSVTLALSKKPTPILEYRDLVRAFAGKNPALAEIRQEIIKIRNLKYPFPVKAKNGNAGSFFKNINLDETGFNDLLARASASFGENAAQTLDKKTFRENNSHFKVPSAALIELCGLADLNVDGAKINHNQPLVIVNESGRASAKDVLSLAKEVIDSVLKTFGVKLQVEPILLGFSSEELKLVE
ncbi:MAG: UDP-N-acetylmuramate dehydrogenase [Patescibacteria group bacterium]|nr:UDP-N-acetylmuramate dehydrogenase [Patescibacteria group bacterium]